MLLEFQSSAFDRSATSPINNLRDIPRIKIATAVRLQKGAANHTASP
jgi:hypothetical protein